MTYDVLDAEVDQVLANLERLSPLDQAEFLEALDELNTRELQAKCREDFIEFCKFMQPEFRAGAHHKRLAQLLGNIETGEKDRIAVSVPPRHGKLVADSTPILTTNGWTTHGELRPGDYVFGINGSPIKVLACSAPDTADIDMEFSDGSVIKVHKNHEWGLYFAPTEEYKVVETRYFLEPNKFKRIPVLHSGTRGRRGSKNLYRLPHIQACEFQEKDLVMSPYALGVWLGDGTTSKPCLTINAEDLAYIWPELERLGYEESYKAIHKDTGVPSIGLYKNEHANGLFHKQLKQLELIGDKHIPEVYLRGSLEQRLELLAGLIDTDGYVEKDSQRVRYCTTSTKIRDGVFDLATTLGFHPYITKEQPKLSSSGVQGQKVVYQVIFQPKLPVPTRVPRKQVTGYQRRPCRRSLVSVRPGTPERGKCIQVDSPDGLYLVGKNMTPTHNSNMISILYPAWYLGKNPTEQIMLVSHTADLAVDFGRKVRNLIATEKYAKIFPNTSLSKDSKSAGRWNTTDGGGFYATGVGSALAGRGSDLCLAPGTLVTVYKRGLQPIESVKRGDMILSHSGYVPVYKASINIATEETVVNGVKTTPGHPHWVFGKGFIPAQEIKVGDLLWTIPIWDKIWSSIANILGVNNGTSKTQQVSQPSIQHLGDDAPAVHQSQGGKLLRIWRTRYKGLRSLGQVQKFLRGYGRPSYSGAHFGSDRQRRGLFPRELSLGGYINPEQQSQGQCEYNRFWKNLNVISVGQRDWVNKRDDKAPDIRYGHGPRSGPENQTNESCETPHITVEFGWLRGAVARWLSRSDKVHEISRLRQTQETVTSQIKERPLRALGVLVGVRRVTQAETYPVEETPYFNLEVGGDNTFYVDDLLLTHNCIIDDPHHEQNILAGDYSAFDKTYEWFTIGARTRLMKGGKIAVVHTRWHEADLIGRLIQDMTRDPNTDQYEVFEFPAILNEGTDQEKALWPEFFDLDALHRIKAGMPTYQWNAQYQQNPTGREGAIVPREKWRKWPYADPPTCDYLIMSIDAAAETKNRSDFSVISMWGVFRHEKLTDGEPHIMLINVINERMQFPELKKRAYIEYEAYMPDSVVVEKKSNGVALYQEMRRTGIPVQEFNPSRATGDKIVRLNAVADMFESGMVWYPEGRRWAEELVEQVASFPASAHDDMVDVTSMALARFRQGGFIRLPTDLKYDDIPRLPTSRKYY